MAQQQPITLDLPLTSQTINVDIESTAPAQGFTADSYDVANSTITATVHVVQQKMYRLVLHADVEAGTHATVRVVSASEAKFKDPIEFRRIKSQDSEIIEPVLQKAGIAIAPDLKKEDALEQLAKQFKIADIQLEPGTHVLRIHSSQKLEKLEGNPKKYRLVMYAPLLSFSPSSNVRLAATLVLPLDFNSMATINSVRDEPLPGLPTPNLAAGGHTPLQLGGQHAYGWLYQNIDPKIIVEYTYN